jgi:SAM-dependent methyltransferase
MAKKHTHSKTYYNDIALRLGHKLLGLDHLHYGYFDKKLAPTLANVPAAQDAYVKNLLSYLPTKGIKRIFDVGCGTGGVASHLVKKGYSLTCLAPDPFLIKKTLENTGGKVETITDLYENITDLPAGIYDLILMSESAQYIKIDEGWKLNAHNLRDGGYVLIGDFFRIRELDQPHLSKSGHPIEKYIQAAEANGFELLKKVDITEFVAPTMDIYQEIILEKIFPVAEALFEFLRRRNPFVYRMLEQVLAPQVRKIKNKYSNQDAATFRKYKGYFVILFKKK